MAMLLPSMGRMGGHVLLFCMGVCARLFKSVRALGQTCWLASFVTGDRV